MLFRGGLRDAEVLLAEFDAVGLGVEDILIAASSCDMSDILASKTVVGYWNAPISSQYTSKRLNGVVALCWSYQIMTQ